MNPSSIADFSLQAARRYIQSAVFIDDNIYNQSTASLDEIKVEARQPKAVIQVDPSGENTISAEAAPDPIPEVKPPFRTKDLVGAFAKHGIVCALYEPEPNFATGEDSTVLKLCQTADLVVLDWDFHEVGISGTKPKALIDKLITSGNRSAPHHVRLIAIYTNTQGLGLIANSIFQHLQKAHISSEPVGGCSLRLQSGATRIIVLGKAGGVTRVEAEQPFTVPERDLADTLLSEFAAMNQGVLPSCALLGMAAVRRNSRRILGKFHSDLDAQFLLHRALIRSSEEAFDQLPELLGDEFKAVIEDSIFRPDNATQFVLDCCGEVKIKPHTTAWKIDKQDCHIVLREFWAKENSMLRVLKGKKGPPEDGDQPKKEKVVENLALMCSVEDAEAHQKFAALLAGRTQYQAKHRDLGFGVVIMDRSNSKYSVCIMPLCDSLRLDVATAFPFWRLEAAGKGNPVIVQRDDGNSLRLVFAPGKPSRQMWMAKFVPDAASGVARTIRNTDGKYLFKSDEVEFEWIAQLKPSHAQRIANAIGQQLSRVGLTEAEWARMSFASDDSG